MAWLWGKPSEQPWEAFWPEARLSHLAPRLVACHSCIQRIVSMAGSPWSRGSLCQGLVPRCGRPRRGPHHGQGCMWALTPPSRARDPRQTLTWLLRGGLAGSVPGAWIFNSKPQDEHTARSILRGPGEILGQSSHAVSSPGVLEPPTLPRSPGPQEPWPLSGHRQIGPQPHSPCHFPPAGDPFSTHHPCPPFVE